MPCGGQSSFLHCQYGQSHRERCVSMPCGGQSSFLPGRKLLHVTYRGVSMPCGGQSSFLQPFSYLTLFVELQCVNALWRAVLISTGFCKVVKEFVEKRVNALWRAVLISTYHAAGKELQKIGVNALWRAVLISTLPPLRASVYAGFSVYFCRYFSEYSEKCTRQGAKVGNRRIVLIQIQSAEAFY